MKTHVKKLRLLLLISVAGLTACATSLANRTPVDIASNSVRRTDALSGISEVLAPQVKAFASRRANVRGRAQLRTAGPFTDDQGVVQTGGAYLEVLLNYTSATPNPAEARIYDQASWPGGEPALLADFGASVLDCREDIRAIPRYDYTPIYGAWGYGHIHDDHCDHEYGGLGWDSGYGHYGHGHVHDDHCGHDVDRDEGSNTVIVRPTTSPRPVSRPVSRPDTDRPQRRPGAVVPHLDGPGTDPDVRPHRPRTNPNGPVPHPRALPRTSKRIISRTRPDLVTGSSSRPTSRPAPVSRPKSVSRPKPAPVSRPKSSYKPKPMVSRPVRRSNPRTNTGNSIKRQMNYYPRDSYYNRGRTDYVVRRSCSRQENLRVFIPRERLDAAEINGLILYLRPRGGQEEVLSLPPNYISGFKLAAWSPEGSQLTISGKPLSPIQAAQAPIPYRGNVASTGKTDPNKPIIYGEN